MIFALASALSAALVAIFGKIGMTKVDVTLATTVRAIIMATLLILVTLSLGKWRLLQTIDRSAGWAIVLAGIAGALSWLFYFLALRNGPTSGVAALDRLSVVFVLILAVVFLGEHWTWKSALGAGLLTVGAVLMAIR